MTQARFITLALICPALGTCLALSSPNEAVQPSALEVPKVTKTGNFTLIPASKSGVNLTYPIDLESPHSHLYVSGFACGGVAAGDLDGDGRPDLVFAGAGQKNCLFLNRGEFRFVEQAEVAGIAGDGNWSSSVTLVDIENDGDLDVYVTRYDALNRLYLNDGKARFTEAAGKFGLDLVDASLASAFCDYDCDGDLDLYLLNNRYYAPKGFPSPEPETLSAEQKKYFQLVPGPGGRKTLNIVPRRDRLLRNDAGKFTEVSVAAGITDDPRHGLAATWWDYNKDGWPDLYVSNDFDDPDSLYHNNGDGTFTDVTSAVLPHTAWFSMGADSADINNDGWPDFLAADMSGTTHYKDKTTMGAMGARLWVTQAEPRQYMRNALYLGTGTSRMMEAAYLAGVADSDWTWAVKFSDFDGDGRDDLFLTNGMTRNFNNSDLPFTKKLFTGKSEWDPYEDTPPRKERNLAFHNEGSLRFRNVSEKWGLAHEGMSFAAATADFDLDGDPDLAVVHMDEPVTLYRNDLSKTPRVSVSLVGKKSNRFGIGARLDAKVGGAWQQRWLRPLSGFKSGDEPVAHFGLGSAREIEKLVISWPSGLRQVVENLAGGKKYVLEEAGEPTTSAAVRPSLFREAKSLAKVRHREQEFDDFQFQPLLPNQLSRLGPGSAWGDIDGDGDEDFFLGGACGFFGQLHINQGDGKFQERLGWCGEAVDRGCEDMAALFFDADGDGDLDLFVASGGVEAPPGHPIHADRLYLNDGAGNFAKSHRALPGQPFSSGPAGAADFDRDGDLDLFVGGRVVPGQYPTSPGSRLLRNDGSGQFEDVTATIAPSLAKTGMVTGALWSDADGDGDLDLLLTQEWGPVSLFLNVDGGLQERTAEAGLDQLTGWWNGLTGGDFDGDGDIDYAVSNFGLNTKYHASSKHPALLYYGDLDGSGKKRIVEAEFEGAICYPIRGKSCSTHAMPSLDRKFGSYKQFALAELEDIYPSERLKKATRLDARVLESGILLNDGQARFTFRPLPSLAQIAPAFGLVACELNGDGHLDLALAQNFFTPQPETGRMDGGLSLVLTGNGDGTFQALPPRESGVSLFGDAASLSVVDSDWDGRPELAFAVNAANARSYTQEPGGTLAVRFPMRPGTRMTLKPARGKTQTLEYYAGSGYLSQSAPVLFFASPRENAVLEIRWPDGEKKSYTVRPGTTRIPLK